MKFWVVRRRVVRPEGCLVKGDPSEGGPAGLGSGFRVQFRFFGTKTETEQKQNEERPKSKLAEVEIGRSRIGQTRKENLAVVEIGRS